jgi:hypothetical protein
MTRMGSAIDLLNVVLGAWGSQLQAFDLTVYQDAHDGKRSNELLPLERHRLTSLVYLRIDQDDALDCAAREHAP